MSTDNWYTYRYKNLFFRTLWRYRIITYTQRVQIRNEACHIYDEEVHHG